ncbi:hypothetical protein O3G_MSEX010155 [Manduca sexta]|uniref:Uncharacterized protein n=1 Tax=Manduca sexta TaxID=7130 RepID=A0A921ZGE8_MANSE|nr:hypothetical protein O3G_MSEX010155 [Manduca sexta]
MALDWPSALKEINGINLENYFLHQRDFNCAVYFHKKFQRDRKNICQEKIKKEKNKCKHDKTQQFNTDFDADRERKTNKLDVNNESVLEQTIKFAKNLVPIVIPPSRDKSPTYYTVKTAKKSKRKSKKHTSSCERDATYEKAKCNKVTQTYRKEKVSHRESFSVRESNSRSSRCNTLDDINMNQSLSCTMSEVSERKYRKKEIVHKPKSRDTRKLIVSESFEALATENIAGEGNIKIHLMNNRDKNLLTDGIRDPLLDYIKDCLVEIKTIDVKSGVTALQRAVINNTEKLDCILEKLSSIERKLDSALRNDQYNQKAKFSTLEQLGEDLIEVKEASEDESQDVISKDDKVVEFIYSGRKRTDMSHGEGGIQQTSVGVKTDHGNKQPTRFCWTDSINRKK